MERKVRNIITYKKDIAGAEKLKAEPQFFKHKVAILNSLGKTALELEFLPNGTYRYEGRYVYDQDGKLIRKRLNFVTHKSVEDTVYNYDDSGNLLEELFYINKKLYDRTLIERDAQGRETGKFRIDPDEKLLSREEFSYYETGQLKEHKVFGENGGLESIQCYIINEAGKVERELSAKLKDNELDNEEVLYTYDEQGRKVRSESRDQEGIVQGYVTVKYNEQGKPIRYYSETLGVAASKLVNQITYDDEGRVIGSEYFDLINQRLVSKERLSYDLFGQIREEEALEIDSGTGNKLRHHIIQVFYNYANSPSETVKVS